MAKSNAGDNLIAGKTFRFGCEFLDCGARLDIAPNSISQIIVDKHFCPYCGSPVDKRDESCLACSRAINVIDPETTKFCPVCGNYLKLLNIF